MQLSKLFLTFVFIAAIAFAFTSPFLSAETTDNQSNEPADVEKWCNQFGPEKMVPNAVNEAAENGLRPFLESIPASDLAHYGFNNKNDFDRVSLGQPYRIMTIPPDNLFSCDERTDIFSILTPTNTWLYPILLNGKATSMLTVDYHQDRWQAVAIGSAGFAQQLCEMENTWSDDSGYSRMLVRIFQAKSDLLLISKGNTVNVAPFKSAEISLNLNISERRVPELYATYEIIQRLIPAVQENLEQNDR